MDPSKKHPTRGKTEVWIALALSAGTFLINVLRLFM